MSKLTASYLAGLIDGEGCLDFRIRKDRPKYGVYYSSRLRVTLTDKNLIEWLKDSFGGSLGTRIFENPNWNTAYTWSLSGIKLKPFLIKIQPYLKLKRTQSIILLKKFKIQEQLKIRIKNNDGHLPGYKKRQIEEIEKLYLELRKLNKRGK